MKKPLTWALSLGILAGCVAVEMPEKPPAETMEVRKEAPRVEPGEAVLEWDVPMMRDDGSCLWDLKGFVVSWGTGPDQLLEAERIPLEELSCRGTGEKTPCGEIQRCTFTVKGLSPGTWYFVVRAYDEQWRESEPSVAGQKTIDASR